MPELDHEVEGVSMSLTLGHLPVESSNGQTEGVGGPSSGIQVGREALVAAGTVRGVEETPNM
jgi:hypothetical protein